MKTQLASLIRRLSYREGDFTLASGKKSSFYIDLKVTTLHPEGIAMISALMFDQICRWRDPKKIGGVGGMSIGADPLATGLSLIAHQKSQHWPAYLVRKEAKVHGTSRYVEGVENLNRNEPLVVLEDVVTTGGSSIKAIERLREAGLKPGLVLTVVDRGQGAADAFRAAGVEFLSLCDWNDIISAR
jgi:orotate phosphoribosyltransferase